MRNRMRTRIAGLILAGVMILTGRPGLWAQSNSSAASGDQKPAPRRPDGKPDLTGVWGVAANIDYFTKDVPPFTEWGAARYKVAREGTRTPLDQGREDVDPMLSPYCMVPGFPRIYLRPSPVEIAQTRDRVLMLFEVNTTWRVIYMDGREHPQGAPPTWMGHSVGRWDGDTLAVETVAMNELTWLDSMGTPHSDALRIDERIRRVAEDRMEMDLTFEDPKAYTRPWRGTRNWVLKPDWQLMEYGVCDTPATDLYLEEVVQGKYGE